MPSRILFLILTAWLVAPPLLADWVRLQEGEVARLLVRSGDQARIRRADGTEEVVPWEKVNGVLTDSQARRLVDEVLAKMRESAEHHEAIKKTLKQIGPAAVPTLLDRLRSARKGFDRACVMACFQFVWSAEAKEAVIAGLTDEEAQVRTMAKNALMNHLRPSEHVEIFRRIGGEGDPEIAAIALAEELLRQPDAERLREGLRNRGWRKHLAPLLARHHDPAAWQADAEALLSGSEPAEVLGALLSLTYQFNDAPSVKAKAARCLNHAEPRVRDVAADYFRWCGDSSDEPELTERLAGEADAWVKASLEAALAAIARRSEIYGSAASAQGAAKALEVSSSLAVVEKVTAVESWWSTNRTASGRTDALTHLRRWIPVAPYHRHGFVNDMLPPDLERAVQVWAGILNDVTFPRKTGTAGFPEIAPSPAAKLQAPVRDYWDPERESFGLLVDPKKYPGEPFQGKVHVGDDVAWHLPGSSVVAIGDGVVRLVSSLAGSWGGLVVLEHVRADGARFCSVYGHLAPALCVEAGQRIGKGDKVGSLGRDWTYDNGGFAAHLHFGIYEAPYSTRALAGYLPPPAFERESARGWVDPQMFLKRYGAAGG